MMYPNPYQPQYLPYYNQYQPQQNTGNIKFDTVSGRTAADVYSVDAGQQAILFDIDNPVVYKKQRSLENKLSMEIYDLTLRQDEPEKATASINPEEFVKASELPKFVEDAVNKAVDKKISEISFKPTRKTTKSEETA